MTTEELQKQIGALLTQIAILQAQLSSVKNYDVVPPGIIKNKNYKDLLDRAEGAFLRKDYLEAFLIQSCIIEGVLKEYYIKKLSVVISQSPVLERKFKNFEWARLIDELFISGKIKKDLYESLNNYRNKRNDVVHNLLEHKNEDELKKDLKEVYESGKHIKGFIVDDMNKEIQGGLTVIELDAQVNMLLSQIEQLQSQLDNPVDNRQ